MPDFTFDRMVYFLWAWGWFTGISFMGLGLYWGLYRWRSLLFWRRVKLLSAILGVVGLLMLVGTTDQFIRDSGHSRLAEVAYDQMIDLKLAATRRAAIECSKEIEDLLAQKRCAEVIRINSQLSLDKIRRHETVTLAIDTEGDAWLEGAVKQTNDRLSLVNRALTALGDRSTFSLQTRLLINGLAMVLIAIALGGAVGDAAYQYRVTRDAA